MSFFPLNAMFNLIKEPFQDFKAVQSSSQQMGVKLRTQNYGVHLV